MTSDRRSPSRRIHAVVAALTLVLCGASQAQPVVAKTQEAQADPCTEFVARLPNVKGPLCAAAGLKATVGKSVQGRPLYQRDVVAPEARLRVLVVGAMHGDELSSASVALHWIQRATETPSPSGWSRVTASGPSAATTWEPRA